MKIIHQDFKHGSVKVKVENLDDIWYLNQIIEPQDQIEGKTERKIKLGGDGDRKQQVSKKTIFLTILVDKVELGEEAHQLRVSGTVTEGPEDVPHGSHHSFSLEENTIVTIKKPEWLSYQVAKIKEASSDLQSNIMICVHDREEAYFALLKKYGLDIISNIKGSAPSKKEVKQEEGHFYKQVIEQLQSYDGRYTLSKIILASPAFWKEDLVKKITDENFKKKIILATTSSVGENGLNEVLKRPEATEALKQDRVAKEFKAVEKLLEEISKQNLATYGMQETKNAAEAGAVATLLVADSFIQKTREENTYPDLEAMMKSVDKAKGEVIIVSSDHDAGKKLVGLGGVGAVLRYKIS